jgi:predicted nucleotidyltransferase
MTDISHDLSTSHELQPLARIVNALDPVAKRMGTEFFLMGAAARDVLLGYAYRIDVGRQTADVDFGVMVSDWNSYEALRQSLIASGGFSSRPGPATHRLRHRDGLPIDIVPFGGVEKVDRTIAWPPNQSIVFDCFGMREALNNSIPVKLPEEAVVRVASIPSLVILKTMAWSDRKHESPGKDATDLFLYLRNYLECGNFDRMVQDHADILDDPGFDYAVAGARLLGRDVAEELEGRAIERLLAILLPEADSDGHMLLASQTGNDLERARELLQAMCDGLADAL